MIISRNPQQPPKDPRQEARDALFKNPSYVRFRDRVDLGSHAAGFGAVGYGLGVGAGAILHAGMGASANYTILGPTLGTLAGGLWGAAIQTKNKNLELAARAATTGSLAAVVGDGAGHVLHHLLGSSAYLNLAPATAGLTGAFSSLASNDKDKTRAQGWSTAATTFGLTGVASTIGDAVGQGLTHLTGNPLYAALAPAAGAVNGALTGLAVMLDKDSKANLLVGKALPLTLGLSAGLTAGSLAGALLTSLTGAPLYNTVAPLLGAFAGTATGVAIAFGGDDKAPPAAK